MNNARPLFAVWYVHMLAFCTEKGETTKIREIKIPMAEMDAASTMIDKLSVVYNFGQNEVQNLPMPSVSAGDVIESRGTKSEYFLIKNIGFVTITPEQLNEYQQTPRRDRFMLPLMLTVTSKRIAWLDSADMASHIHRTTDKGETTVCGHKPKSEKNWKITSQVPRAISGEDRHCPTCFKNIKKSIPFLDFEDERVTSGQSVNSWPYKGAGQGL